MVVQFLISLSLHKVQNKDVFDFFFGDHIVL